MYLRHEIGRKGEQEAAQYLKKRKYLIIERNFRCSAGEIDIITKDKKTKELVFVEVKTRTNSLYGTPAEAVNKIKQKHLYQTIQQYLKTKKLENVSLRIDIIEVFQNPDNSYQINHIKQAIEDR